MQCKVGWGRVGRGEFAFYLADVGHSVGIVGTEAYAITVWALLNGSMGFPFAFRAVMEASSKVCSDHAALRRHSLFCSLLGCDIPGNATH